MRDGAKTAEAKMANFTINGKEHELKLTYKGVKKLNGLYDGGAFAVLGKAMMGDLDTFPHIIQAALIHTDENYTLEAVEQAIDEAMDNESLDLDAIIRLSNEVVTQSFFYKATVNKLLADNKPAKKALEQLLK